MEYIKKGKKKIIFLLEKKTNEDILSGFRFRSHLARRSLGHLSVA
jgi:hypothetical protein